MAMRTEQHGNLFAKLNYGNLSDGAVRDEKMRLRQGRAKRRSCEHALSHGLEAGRVDRQAVTETWRP